MDAIEVAEHRSRFVLDISRFKLELRFGRSPDSSVVEAAKEVKADELRSPGGIVPSMLLFEISILENLQEAHSLGMVPENWLSATFMDIVLVGEQTEGREPVNEFSETEKSTLLSVRPS